MQIQTIEEKTGLDRATIRYYEKEGLIQPQRLQNGYRDYSQDQLNDLMKIKLLRQLGLSLDTIQCLIEGKDNLHSILENQLVLLNAHMNQIESAEMICKMIIQDNVTYQTLEPNKYIGAMNKQHPNNKIIEPHKNDYVHPESHPFRRFLGRYLDQILTSAVLMILVITVLRVRPFGQMHNTLLSVAALFLMMPLNALFLCLFGTTPGKYAVGIHLKDLDGRNMSFFSALKREWDVFRYGSGFNLPIYSWIRLFKSYRIHSQGQELEWDYDNDIVYTQCGTGKIIYGISIVLICFATIFYCAFDSQYPKYRNDEITVAQFSNNLNDYAAQSNSIIRLSPEGEWYTADGDPVIAFDSETEIVENWEFIADENQILKSICCITNTNTPPPTPSRWAAAPQSVPPPSPP